MNILIVHNFYQQAGGEDIVFKAEIDLMQNAGHNVLVFTEDNGRVEENTLVHSSINLIWSRSIKNSLKSLLRKRRPDIVHFHNIFMRISPSAYYACQEAAIPIVQTLHNYRLLCPTATLYRQGKICENCLGKTVPWPSVLHGCYRNSHLQTAVVATMLTTHRLLRTWQQQVDIYIALSEFARQKFIAGGLPAEKIVVKSNFIDPDPGPRLQSGAYALFVGRLAAEKGVQRLLEAWRQLPAVPLKVVGAGPLEATLEMLVDKYKLTNVEILGRRDNTAVLQLMKGASFLIFPSEWYEGFPVTIGEAFACGLPVIATGIGAMAELVQDGYTGLHFRYGDVSDLAAKVQWAWNHPIEMARMGKAARHQYEQQYTAERNYAQLMAIYERAIVAKRTQKNKAT